MKQPVTDRASPSPDPRHAGASAGLTRLLRISDVRSLTGLGRNTIYRWISEGLFPCPVSLGGKRVAWKDDEIRQWIATRPRATSIRFESDAAPWGERSRRSS